MQVVLNALNGKFYETCEEGGLDVEKLKAL